MTSTPYVVYKNRWNELHNVDKCTYTHTKYTPIVSEDADDFAFDGYKLRYQNKNKIKLLVGITVYNESFKVSFIWIYCN